MSVICNGEKPKEDVPRLLCASGVSGIRKTKLPPSSSAASVIFFSRKNKFHLVLLTLFS
jgi:hypothetical protein